MTISFSGIKFFYDDVINMNFGGTVTASSASSEAELAFDGNNVDIWQSEDENDDEIKSYIERVLDSEVSGDTLIIANHNLKSPIITINDVLLVKDTDYTIQTKNGFSVVSFTALKTDILKIKISGDETEIADSEKQIGNVLLLTVLGQLNTPQELKNSLNFEQGELSLQNGKKFIFDCGESWEFKLSMFGLDQDDIDLFEIIRKLKRPFFMWPCGGNEEQFEYHFEPFLFNNFFKVAVVDATAPNLKDNMYWTGLRDAIKFVEVE